MDTSQGPAGRLFIAVPLPGRMARSLSQFSARLEAKLPGRYVTAENYHVTLAFIGEAPLSLKTELGPFLRETAARFPALPAAFSALGFFGSEANAILWAGLKDGETLLPLADAVRSGLRERGIPLDRKPVRPHITIARKVNLEGTALPALPSATGQMDTLTLYHSTRVQGRLTYLPLAQAPLGAADR